MRLPHTGFAPTTTSLPLLHRHRTATRAGRPSDFIRTALGRRRDDTIRARVGSFVRRAVCISDVYYTYTTSRIPARTGCRERPCTRTTRVPIYTRKVTIRVNEIRVQHTIYIHGVFCTGLGFRGTTGGGHVTSAARVCHGFSVQRKEEKTISFSRLYI